jgi:hypothetical protein
MNKRPIIPSCHETAEGTVCLQHRVCPHWSPSNRACLLVKDGLFLPVEQHITAYCTSNHFTSCRQYQLLAGAEIRSSEDDSLPVNRRRSIRIPSHHVFRFSEITGSDQRPGRRDDDAWTIDLSNGGLRFASRWLLIPDTVIHFTLETEGAAANLEGRGRVVWSEPLESTPMFHAGLVFTETPLPATAS